MDIHNKKIRYDYDLKNSFKISSIKILIYEF